MPMPGTGPPWWASAVLSAGDREFLGCCGLGPVGHRCPDFKDSVGVGGFDVFFLYAFREGDVPAEGTVTELGPVTAFVLVFFLFLPFGMYFEDAVFQGYFDVLVGIDTGHLGADHQVLAIDEFFHPDRGRARSCIKKALHGIQQLKRGAKDGAER